MKPSRFQVVVVVGVNLVHFAPRGGEDGKCEEGGSYPAWLGTHVVGGRDSSNALLKNLVLVARGGCAECGKEEEGRQSQQRKQRRYRVSFLFNRGYRGVRKLEEKGCKLARSKTRDDEMRTHKGKQQERGERLMTR
jgi:hypothetical protein